MLVVQSNQGFDREDELHKHGLLLSQNLLELIVLFTEHELNMLKVSVASEVQLFQLGDFVLQELVSLQVGSLLLNQGKHRGYIDLLQSTLHIRNCLVVVFVP